MSEYPAWIHSSRDFMGILDGIARAGTISGVFGAYTLIGSIIYVISTLAKNIIMA